MTPRAKKGPRTLAGFHGGDGGEPNTNRVPRRPLKSKPNHPAAPFFEGAAFAVLCIAAALLILKAMEAAR